MADPFGIPLRCPKCGATLKYQHSQGVTHFYVCPRDGRLVLPPDGPIRRDDPSDSAVRH